MKSCFLKFRLLLLIIPTAGFSQIDTVDILNKRANPQKVSPVKRTYIVYLQDSVDGPKYNLEIWDREFHFLSEEQQYQLRWTRSSAQKGKYSSYLITTTKDLKPKYESIEKHENVDVKETIKNIRFRYQNDSLISSNSTSGGETSVYLNGLTNAFNWEMDLEILSALNWQANKKVVIAFYHPGSKTPPAYYHYTLVGDENLSFAGCSIDCWIIEHRLNENQVTRFWLSKADGNILLVKDEFYGMIRFKRLVI